MAEVAPGLELGDEFTHQFLGELQEALDRHIARKKRWRRFHVAGALLGAGIISVAWGLTGAGPDWLLGVGFGLAAGSVIAFWQAAGAGVPSAEVQRSQSRAEVGLTEEATGNASGATRSRRETLEPVSESRPGLVPEADQTVPFDSLLELASSESQLQKAQAERRKDRLFLVGVALIALSVLAPLGGAYLYRITEPLSESSVVALRQLTDGGAEPLPQGISVRVERDWRVLLGGISLGFLLLAAARGLMTQHERQEARYSLLAERTSLIDVLRVARRVPDFGDSESQRILRLLALRELLSERGPDAMSTGSASDSVDQVERALGPVSLANLK